ncbi:MAG: lipid-binding SYLF domain-containing protein [Verrucomicrobiota bacterium]
MKSFLLGLTLLGFVTSASALDKAQLDYRIRKLTAKFEAMQLKPDKRIPAEYLKQAEGIVLLDRTKAGFIFAYQGGSGVAMVKNGKAKEWSAAAFVEANEASLGFQVGGQQAFVVILLMTTNATQALTESTFEFGGEARGTAGNSSAGEEGKFSSTEHSVLVYIDRSGLYGGAAIKGGALSPDDEANHLYYGKFLTMSKILFDKSLKPTETAVELAKKITEHSKEPEKK